MALIESKPFKVILGGIDITRLVRSVLFMPEIKTVNIEINEEFTQPSGETQRHLKGLLKAKN